MLCASWVNEEGFSASMTALIVSAVSSFALRDMMFSLVFRPPPFDTAKYTKPQVRSQAQVINL
jgi:hypothetical protein